MLNVVEKSLKTMNIDVTKYKLTVLLLQKYGLEVGFAHKAFVLVLLIQFLYWCCENARPIWDF